MNEEINSWCTLQRAHDVIIILSLRQNVVTSFLRNNSIIITSYVRWAVVPCTQIHYSRNKLKLLHLFNIVFVRYLVIHPYQLWMRSTSFCWHIMEVLLKNESFGYLKYNVHMWTKCCPLRQANQLVGHSTAQKQYFSGTIGYLIQRGWRHSHSPCHAFIIWQDWSHYFIRNRRFQRWCR